MAKAKALPTRPNLGFLKRVSKEKLAELRATNSRAKLADAQLVVAREHGFPSWRRLKAHVYSVSADSPDRVKAFFDLIRSNQIDRVRTMLRESPQLLEAADGDGTRAIHVALEPYQAEIFSLLVKAGADPNPYWGRYGHTALSWAVVVGAIDAARLLIQHGAKADLYTAAGLGDLALVQSFFPGGKLVANPSQTGSSRYDKDGNLLPPLNTPRECLSDALCIASRNGHADVVRFLLQHHPDLGFRSYMGGTALHWTYFSGSKQVIQLLLAAGADANARDDEFKSPPRAFGIYTAANWGIPQRVANALQTDPTLLNVREGRGTPLTEAVRGGHTKIVAALLSVGADKHLADSDRKTPLQLAIENDQLDIIELLGGKRRKQPWKPIMDAAFLGDVDRVRKLLDAGADPNALGTTGHKYRPLHRAIEHKKTMPKHEGHDAVVKLLLERGADPKLRATYDNATTLELAAMNEPRFVPLLRPHFEPLDVFHAALLADDKRVAALLDDNPALVSARNSNGWTALHYAAASLLHRESPRHSETLLRITKLLLDKGADAMAAWNWNDEWPLRPLFYACGRSNNPQIAEMLIRAGADPCDGESVYHASDEGHDECLAVIERMTDPTKLAAECSMCLAGQLHWGRTRGMKWLLTHGADPDWVHPKHKRSALQEAIRQKRNKDVIALLRTASRKRR